LHIHTERKERSGKSLCEIEGAIYVVSEQVKMDQYLEKEVGGGAVGEVRRKIRMCGRWKEKRRHWRKRRKRRESRQMQREKNKRWNVKRMSGGRIRRQRSQKRKRSERQKRTM
jgi:hypothetical protein